MRVIYYYVSEQGKIKPSSLVKINGILNIFSIVLTLWLKGLSWTWGGGFCEFITDRWVIFLYLIIFLCLIISTWCAISEYKKRETKFIWISPALFSLYSIGFVGFTLKFQLLQLQRI